MSDQNWDELQNVVQEARQLTRKTLAEQLAVPGPASVARRSDDTGKWMQTYLGKAFWLDYPSSNNGGNVSLVDVAHSLAMQCRFGGHSTIFYSVAEHSVLVSQAVPAEDAAWGLLHDATEAYLGDVVRPLKQLLPDYQRLEAAVETLICDRFGLTYRMPESVKDADTRVLLNERAAVMSPEPRPYEVDELGLEPLDVEVHGWSPTRAKRAFLERAHELGVR